MDNFLEGRFANKGFLFLQEKINASKLNAVYTNKNVS